MKTSAAHSPGPARSTPQSGPAPRILTAVPTCDGHDSAIMTVNLELVRRGVEVIYLGYHRSVADVVRAAIQEDVQGVGLSSYNGGHIEFFDEVLRRLRRFGARHIGVFGGGGGTITAADARLMKRRGVDEIFLAGAPLSGMGEWVRRTYTRQPTLAAQRLHRPGPPSDLHLARLLSTVSCGHHAPAPPAHASASLVIGITGPGGAGKTTLLDELVLRFLNSRPHGRLAILTHDPCAPGHGALLGDRATMVCAQDDRVFMRSLATTGRARGVSQATRGCLRILRHAGFDVVFVESAGVGQEDLPFARGLVDKQILVMSPEYGGRLQLQKTALLEVADFVVVNKADLAGARTALAELEQRLALNQRGQRLLATVAKRHCDQGVDQLFREVLS